MLNTDDNTMTASDHTPSGAARVFVLIPTHTTRHLRACIASVAALDPTSHGVVVTCDTDDPEIAQLIDTTWNECSLARKGTSLPTLVHTSRAHQNEARLNQVRNNGLRALDATFGLRDDDIVVVLDGDTLLARDAIAHYRSSRDTVDLVVPFRVYLEESTTSQLDINALVRGAASTIENIMPAPNTTEIQLLRARHTRYERQAILRKCGLSSLVKSHKPKIIGGHHAVRVGALRRINGYDEAYVGYGFDDDDVSRRLYELRPRICVRIAINDILAFHLWHPTRAPASAVDAPGYARFSRTDLPTWCARGWDTPVDQPEPIVRTVVVR